MPKPPVSSHNSIASNNANKTAPIPGIACVSSFYPLLQHRPAATAVAADRMQPMATIILLCQKVVTPQFLRPGAQTRGLPEHHELR
jgi:hypothetical protein